LEFFFWSLWKFTTPGRRAEKRKAFFYALSVSTVLRWLIEEGERAPAKSSCQKERLGTKNTSGAAAGERASIEML
jgi:hypothetical protein